jgi:hypothetical protein
MDTLSSLSSAASSAVVKTAKTAADAVVVKPLSFVSGFFVNRKGSIDPLTAEALQRGAATIFSYLTLKESVKFSSCSIFTSNALLVPKHLIQRYLDSSSSSSSSSSSWRLLISTSLTAGNVRRLMHSLQKMKTASLYLDPNNGHIMLDLGSAFHSRDAFLSSSVIPLVGGGGSSSSTTTAEDDEAEVDQPILRNLEANSYDELDDYNPRHPNPRDMSKIGHRRGDSYFNSDIEAIAQEALAGIHSLDLSALASKALEAEGLPQQTKARRSRVTSKLGMSPSKTRLSGQDGPDAGAGNNSSDEEDDSPPAPSYDSR